jgi:hypothetical protein
VFHVLYKIVDQLSKLTYKSIWYREIVINY